MTVTSPDTGSGGKGAPVKALMAWTLVFALCLASSLVGDVSGHLAIGRLAGDAAAIVSLPMLWVSVRQLRQITKRSKPH